MQSFECVLTANLPIRSVRFRESAQNYSESQPRPVTAAPKRLPLKGIRDRHTRLELIASSSNGR